MEYLRKWLLRPTVVTSGVAVLLIALASVFSPGHHAAASPQSAYGAATVLGGKTAVVTPRPTATKQRVVAVQPTAVPTNPSLVLPPPATTVPVQPPPTVIPPPVATATPAPPAPTATPAPPTPTPTPSAGVLQMSPSGFTFTNCTTGTWVPMTIKNVGQQSLTWTATMSASSTTYGVFLSPTSGTLAPGASTTLSLNGFFRVVTGATNSVSVFTSYTSAKTNHAGPFVTQFCN